MGQKRGTVLEVQKIQTEELSEYGKELGYFIEHYLLRLLGLPERELKPYHVKMNGATAPASVIQRNSGLFFTYDNECHFFLPLDKAYTISEDDLKLSRRILQSYDQLCQYKRTGDIQNNILNKLHRENIYKAALQDGICHWIAGDELGTSENKIDELLSILEQWSVKTYEGRSVTFGFVIDPDAHVHKPLLPNPVLKSISAEQSGDEKYNFLSFLRDDTSAVLTDCIHSVILLDRQCEFMDFASISEGNIMEKEELDPRVPLRFTRVINRYVGVDGNKVGIFLLNNGDIILSKNGEIRFVKRNLQWLNFSFTTFRNVLTPFIKEHKIDASLSPTSLHPRLVDELFASVLDVSFSHTGGIIAVVNPDSTFLANVLNKFDNYNLSYFQNRKSFDSNFLRNNSTYKYERLDGNAICTVLYNDEHVTESQLMEDCPGKTAKQAKEEANAKNNDTVKKLLKRAVIQKLIRDDQADRPRNKTFQELDRKLRSELIALDGACILNTKGEIYSFGAIISNDSGSTGGGRGAAAKKLSAYGMAIKISTDGYIELYVNRSLRYSVK